jgi:hypothetical protein
MKKELADKLTLILFEKTIKPPPDIPRKGFSRRSILPQQLLVQRETCSFFRKEPCESKLRDRRKLEPLSVDTDLPRDFQTGLI